MRKLVFLLAALSLTAFAADVTGNWKASLETPNGSMEFTYVLKADGNTVTGTIQSQMGDMKIDEGKIDGDKISFSVTVENMGKISYNGTVKGDEMTLNFTFAGGGGDMPPMPPIVAKRVK
jgi:autotransporter translocation and assembly factor TamB